MIACSGPAKPAATQQLVRDALTGVGAGLSDSAAVTCLVGDSLTLIGAVVALPVASQAARRLDARHEHTRGSGCAPSTRRHPCQSPNQAMRPLLPGVDSPVCSRA